MARTTTRRGGSPGGQDSALRQAIAADAIGCFVDNAIVSGDDVGKLRAILAGQESPGFEVDRKRALGALARSDKSAATGEVLGRILADEKLPNRERAAAVAWLGLMPAAVAERPLLTALHLTSGALRADIIKVLGQIGRAEALVQLDKVALPEDDIARRPLALAKLAIGFRDGQNKGGPDDLSGALDIRWTTIEAKPLPAKGLRETIAAVGSSTYGVPLNQETGFRFECGRMQQVLLLNEELKRGAFLKTLTKSNMIAGLLVSQAEELRYFSVRCLLLTSPGKDGVRVVLVRPNGDPAFEGLATTEKNQLHFTLRDTGLERTPAEITGRVTNEAITWTMRVWRGPLRAKQRPRSIVGLQPAV